MQLAAAEEVLVFISISDEKFKYFPEDSSKYLMASYLIMQSSLELPLLGGYGPCTYCESIGNRYA